MPTPQLSISRKAFGGTWGEGRRVNDSTQLLSLICRRVPRIPLRQRGELFGMYLLRLCRSCRVEPVQVLVQPSLLARDVEGHRCERRDAT